MNSPELLLLRFSGRVADLCRSDQDALFDRGSRDAGGQVSERVAAIISRVALNGDTALFDLARELDDVHLDSLEVPARRLDEALASIDSSLRRAMEHAAENIRKVHCALLPKASEIIVEPGVVVGRRPDPLGRVGVYAPGGRATYPSSVLMGVIPARVAGVTEVILCSPPRADKYPAPVVLGAARLAGVDRVFALGGAGAIAAMAIGTSSIARVDRIVGPGNEYVAEAKLQLSGFASFDSPAGPSELLIIADSSADPAGVVREVIAQAEHDPRAIVLVVAVGDRLAQSVIQALKSAVVSAQRREIIIASLGRQGGVLTVESTSEAIEIASAFAPEHLLLATSDATSLLPLVRNAGTVFVGQTSSVSFGDYVTGANHVLPTGGLARSYSGLSTLDFIRWTTYQSVDGAAAASLAEVAGILADAEELPGHAAAARAWRTG